MKFIVLGVSLLGIEHYKEKIKRIQIRTVDDPSKLNEKEERENWYKEGENHRVENGCIKRDFVSEEIVITINSLEELDNILMYNNDKELIIGYKESYNLPIITKAY